MLSRSGCALTVLAALSVGLLGPDASRAVDDLQGPSLSTALVGLGCLVQLAVSAWVLVVVGLSRVHAPPPFIRALAPRLLRDALFASTAGVLALSPVHADRAVPSGSHDVSGLQLPDRPIAAVPQLPSRPDTGGRAVVVRRGDTLWAIAARSLPAGADDSEIARVCALWHAANRGVIGDDPDLIFPRQRLHPPLGKDPT